MAKIEITQKQKENYNNMLAALKTIYQGYQTPEELRKNCEKQYGLDFEETIEMSYENIQLTAQLAAKGVRTL